MKIEYIFLVLIVIFTIFKSSQHAKLRITGGDVTTIEKHPYFAQIYRKSRGSFCGGSIIHTRAILTAASCCNQAKNKDFKIWYGSNMREQGSANEVALIVPHNADDIAVMITSDIFEVTNTTGIISLATKPPIVRDIVLLVGFGRTKPGGSFSKHLIETPVAYLNSESCQSLTNGEVLPRAVICAVSMYNKDACDGDEGGPMVHNGELVGIIKKNYHCGDNAQTPTTLTLVTEYVDWIFDSIDKNINLRETKEMQDSRTICHEMDRSVLNWLFKDLTIPMNLNFCLGVCVNKEANAQRKATESCAPTPISDHEFIVSLSCAQNNIDINLANFTIYFNENVYNIKKVMTGSQLLPFFTNSKYDIAIITIVDTFQSNVKTFNIFPIFQNIIPSRGYLLKFIANQEGKAFKIPVEILQSTVCIKLAEKSIPFKVIPDMFCVMPYCKKKLEAKYNLCSDKAGSPIFNINDEIIGVIIWQETCLDETMPIIGLQVAKFIQIYKERSIQ